jgi:hypothetical protein
MTDYKYWDLQQGQVIALGDEDSPPISTLVEAFQKQGLDAATDAIVLRGYLGRSDIVRRILKYLVKAQETTASKPETTAVGTVVEAGKYVANADLTPPGASVTWPAIGRDPTKAQLEALKNEEIADLEKGLTDVGAESGAIAEIIAAVKELEPKAREHIPWRLYLTPRLDTYVDFHRSSLLAYRRDARTERQDACTVWLRVFDPDTTLPIAYRVVRESMLGPSFAQWLDGAVVDDYVEQGGAVGTAWGDQSAVFGRKVGTGTGCAVFGRKSGTGTVCGE